MAHAHTVNASTQDSHTIAWLGDDGTLTVYCESCDESADYRFYFDPYIDDECDECAYAKVATAAMADALHMFSDDHDCGYQSCEGHTTNTPYETIYCDGSCRS